jgi:hypothetical protein
LKYSGTEDDSGALDKETSDICDVIQGSLRLTFKAVGWALVIPDGSCL